MGTKRAAEKVMTHENWNDEEEPEEMGEFKKASEDTMKLRVVRMAKRRNTTTTNSNSIFTSFKGFSSTPSIQPSPGTFDFLKNISKPSSASDTPSTPSLTSKTTGLEAAQKLSATSSLFAQKSLTSSVEDKSLSSSASNGPPSHASKRMKSDESQNESNDSKAKTPAEYTEADEAFFNKIEQLNAKVLKFCTEKFASNPHIIFNPTFQDYRNYVTKYIREKVEHENKLKLEKEKGYDFLSKNMPPVGQAGKITFLVNDKTNETKTFDIGNSSGTGEFGRATVASNTIEKVPPSPFSSGTFKLGSPAASISTNNPLLSKKDLDILKNAKKEDHTVSPADPKAMEVSKTPFLASFSCTGSNPLLSKKDYDTLNSSKNDNQSTSVMESGSKPNNNFSFGLKNEAVKSDSTFSFGLKNGEKNENAATTAAVKSSGTFSFGFKNGEKTESLGTTSASNFSFGLAGKVDGGGTSAASTSKATFSFGSSTNVAGTTESGSTETTEDADDDVLPKEQVKEVLEEDSIFTIKCKVFIKKPDNSYADRGVGNLFVKCIEEKVKCQLVVRAVTDTGKIILNVVVSKNVPVKVDKNNLIFVCVPHPTTDKSPEPCVCIVKVKTKEDADKLLNCLEDFRH